MASRRKVRSSIVGPLLGGLIGFTLPELMIAIVTAGMLFAAALPNFGALVTRSRAVEVKQGLRRMLMEAYALYQYEQAGSAQLLALPMEGMKGGSTMADASDGKYDYYGSLPQDNLYLVEAESLQEPALIGKTLSGCIDLDGGLIMIQRDFDVPLVGCGASANPPLKNAKRGKAASAPVRQGNRRFAI